jgi:DNA-binding response OmpR family regulator
MNQSKIAPHAGRVLVVDDHPSVSQLLSLALQLVGFETIEAGTPAEAWASLNRRQPDALVIDLQYADTVGLDLVRSVRGRPDGEKLPIVFLASQTTEDLRWQALRMGADWFTLKPLSLRELQQRVGDLVRKGRPRLRAAADPAWLASGRRHSLACLAPR